MMQQPPPSQEPTLPPPPPLPTAAGGPALPPPISPLSRMSPPPPPVPQAAEPTAPADRALGASTTAHAATPGAQDARSPLKAGAVVGDYTICSLIGTGGFGITYLATHSTEATPVAIKEHIPEGLAVREPNSDYVIPASAECEARFKATLEEFQAEVTVLMGLSHPGIIPILSAFTANGTAYYVMPFQEGTVMTSIEQATLDEAQQATIARHNKRLLLSMLATLDYLRMHQIVHRDIKPDNIIISPEGAPILLDFGSARQLQPGKVFTNVYTPDFCAPEQSRAKTDEEMSENIGPWTDIYALGVCFYYLITHLFPPRSDLRVLATADPYTPLAGRADLEKPYGKAFLRAIDRALELKPRDRWQRAEDWRMAIEEGLITKAPKETRRLRMLAGIFTVILLVFAGISLWALNEKARAQRSFDNSMRFVEHMLNDFNQELSDIPGSTRLQRILGEHLNTYLNNMDIPKGGIYDEKLLRSLTASWRNYGSLCLQQGKLEEASSAYKRAAGFLRQLISAAPGELTYAYDLASVLLSQVEIARSRNNGEQVHAYLNEAMELLLKLCKEEPSNPDFICATGLALNEEARLARFEGRMDEYRSSLASMLELYRQLEERYPDHIKAREGLGYALQTSAQYAIEQGNFVTAAAYLDEAKAIFGKLSAQYPYRLSFQKGLALTYYSLGNLYNSQSSAAESAAESTRYDNLALEALRKHTSLVNHLETQDANKAEYPYMACRALSTMVDILLRTGQPNIAEAYSNSIMRKTAKLRDKAGDNMDYAVLEATAWRGLAMAHSKSGRYAVKASEEFDHYRHCIENLLQRSSKNSTLQFIYTDALTESASHALTSGQVVQARRWLHQALTTLKKLSASAPENTAFADRLKRVQSILDSLPQEQHFSE